MKMHLEEILDLPNISDIKRIIKSVNEYAAYWCIVVDKENSFWKTQNTLWKSVMVELRKDEKLYITYKALEDVCNAAFSCEIHQSGQGFSSSTDAVGVLMLRPDLAYILDSDPEDVRLLAKIGDPIIQLLLPACCVFEKIRKENA
jgi:hypothetical protein